MSNTKYSQDHFFLFPLFHFLYVCVCLFYIFLSEIILTISNILWKMHIDRHVALHFSFSLGSKTQTQLQEISCPICKHQMYGNIGLLTKYSPSLFLSSTQLIFVDFSEVRWPRPDTDDGMILTQSGSVKIVSLDGHAYLCLPRSQHEFTVHFLCKVSQKPNSSIVLSEKKNQARKDKLVEKAGKTCTYGSLPRQRLKNKENELYCLLTKSKETLEKESCADGAEGKEEPPPPGTRHTCVYTWVKQRWPVASCPEEWKYPLSLALHFHNKISSMSRSEADTSQGRTFTSEISEERGKEVSVLPRALLLSCPVPHLHR